MTHDEAVSLLFQHPDVPAHAKAAAFLVGERVSGERVTIDDALDVASDAGARADCVVALVFGFRPEAIPVEPIDDPELATCIELARLAAGGGD